MRAADPRFRRDFTTTLMQYGHLPMDVPLGDAVQFYDRVTDDGT